MSDKDPIYRITFLNKGQVYEVFARQVYQSELYGFIEIEDYLFDERSQVVVDPGEEKLKSEFNGVKRSFVPLQAIIRIDEVTRAGAARVTNGSNITPFPVSITGGRQHDPS
ncbi:MAG: DUF1820 family protein [Pseudomonadota bacterium]